MSVVKVMRNKESAEFHIFKEWEVNKITIRFLFYKNCRWYSRPAPFKYEVQMPGNNTVLASARFPRMSPLYYGKLKRNGQIRVRLNASNPEAHKLPELTRSTIAANLQAVLEAIREHQDRDSFELY